MATIIKAPNVFPLGTGIPTLFLGGAINMGAAEKWQDVVTEALADKDILILNPRRDDWDSSWKQSINDVRFFEQVNWELDAQDVSHYIIYVFATNEEEAQKSLAPITLMELGLYAGTTNIMVCCPNGYWRKGNVDIVCDRYDIPLFDNLNELIYALRDDLEG